MSNKNISFPIGNIKDTVVNIGGLPYDMTVEELAADVGNDFFIEENPNGQTDLCLSVADTTPDIEANLTEYATGSPYVIMSNDFDVIGGRPATRCPKCPVS